MNLAASALVLALFAQGRFYEAPATAATAPNPEFPLHLRVLSNNRSHNQFGYHGYGRADLLGQPIQGVDYTFDCDRGFMHNGHADEFYQARWKKPNQKMEILLQQVGGNHVEKCTLSVTLKPEPYGRYRKGPGGAQTPLDTPPPPAEPPPQPATPQP